MSGGVFFFFFLPWNDGSLKEKGEKKSGFAPCYILFVHSSPIKNI